MKKGDKYGDLRIIYGYRTLRVIRKKMCFIQLIRNADRNHNGMKVVLLCWLLFWYLLLGPSFYVDHIGIVPTYLMQNFVNQEYFPYLTIDTEEKYSEEKQSWPYWRQWHLGYPFRISNKYKTRSWKVWIQQNMKSVLRYTSFHECQTFTNFELMQFIPI